LTSRQLHRYRIHSGHIRLAGCKSKLNGILVRLRHHRGIIAAVITIFSDRPNRAGRALYTIVYLSGKFSS
jgi:hypothetical protein